MATATTIAARRAAIQAITAQTMRARNATRWALARLLADLVNFDMDTARPGDWLNTRIALDELVRAASADPRAPHPANVINPQRLGDLEAEVREALPDLQRLVRESATGEGALVAVTVKLGALRNGRLLVTGGTRDTAIVMAAYVLTQFTRPPILICPEDGRAFVRLRRQRYCSPRCLRHVYVRGLQARLAAPPTPPRPRRRAASEGDS
jgi:predicted RNA-binding Zn ribbon-like protein